MGWVTLGNAAQEHLLKAGAMVARNRLLSLLSKYFAFALERGLVELNPVTGIKRLTEESRNRVLSDNEIRLFCARHEWKVQVTC